MIGGVVGLLTLLLAVNLALLIWTAYGVYSTQQTSCRRSRRGRSSSTWRCASTGRRAIAAGSMLRPDLVWAHEQFWGDDNSRAAAYEASYKAMGDLITSSTASSRRHRADGTARRRARQLRLHRRAAAPHVASGGDPGRLAACLCGDLLVVPDVRKHGASLETESDVGAMLVLGTASIGLAIFLILEFNKPYTSSIRVSPARSNTIVQLDRAWNRRLPRP